MDTSKMKNMIVIKNLPSNIVEEAFVILKPNKKIKEKQNNNVENKEITQEYVVKEAEMVINNYICNLENEKNLKNNAVEEIKEKYKKMKKATIFLSAIVVLYFIFSII